MSIFNDRTVKDRTGFTTSLTTPDRHCFDTAVFGRKTGKFVDLVDKFYVLPQVDRVKLF